MTGLAGLAGPAGAFWLAQLGQAAFWRPRYTTTATTALAEGATRQPDPHNPTGLAHCPVCFKGDQLTLQRPASTACTTCFGTGWTGGYGGSQAIAVFLTQGTFTLKLGETGELVAVTGVWCRHDPAVPLLPQDMVQVQGLATRYLVGELVQRYGLGAQAFGQMVQVLPLASDDPRALNFPMP